MKRILVKIFTVAIVCCQLFIVFGCQSTKRLVPEIAVLKPTPVIPQAPTVIVNRNNNMRPVSQETAITKPATKNKDKTTIKLGQPLPPLEQFFQNIPLHNDMPFDEKNANLQVSPYQLPAPDANAVRVGLLLPLSGANKKLGEAMLQAAKLALFAFADERLELLVHDTKGTEKAAVAAAQKAIIDGAQIILGPMFSSSVKAIAPITLEAGIPVIAFSSDSTIAGDGIFIMGFTPGHQVRQIIRFAALKGAKSFAVIAPKNTYGETVVKEMERSTEVFGGAISRIEFYDIETKDFSPLIRDIANYETRRASLLAEREVLSRAEDELSKKALKRLEKLQTIGDPPFDALLLAEGGEQLQAIAALLPFFDIDPAVVRILGTGQWDVEGIGAEPALIGGFFAAPDPGFRVEFENEYLKKFKAKPERLATLSYDATALVAVLSQLKEGFRFSNKAITDDNGFLGRDGIFRFLSTGVVERGLAVLKVQRHTNSVVVRAPESFEALIN